MEVADDSQREGGHLARLPWDEEFYDALNASIGRAVSDAMGALEERLSQQTAGKCTKVTVSTPAPTARPVSPGHSQPPSADTTSVNRFREVEVDHDTFAQLKQAFLAQTYPPSDWDIAGLFTEPPPLISPDQHGDDSFSDPDDDLGPLKPLLSSSHPPPPDSVVEGSDMLDPNDILHPWSSEWTPSEKVENDMASLIWKPMEKESHNCLRVECLHPSLDSKVALTPELDHRMTTFLQRFMKYPKKGIDWSWWACQDKLLDVLGPLTKILDMAKDAKSAGFLISSEVLSGWAQLTIISLRNINCALSTERHCFLLIKVPRSLGTWEILRQGSSTRGLFGEPFIKDLGTFGNTFISLDKAQSSIK
ncbi:hypothetical protein NDU88_008483 [Pleurodeles waltl]|uniref:Uncharacterized protein n=1 Tax=Pleurodeles waltl TaxID=8319 RepID=A0AAV7RTX5_PLEWA|nr:hypothetical protein NDU88_008483 [Pleurodeles waltl]